MQYWWWCEINSSTVNWF